MFGTALPDPGPLRPGLALRLAAASDRWQLFGWHVAGLRRHIEQVRGWDTDWEWRDFARHFAAVPPRVVIAEREAVGYLQARRGDDAVYLHNIVLVAAVRGCGIGSTLLTRMQEIASAAALPLVLGVFHTNPRAETFYRRLGFVRSGSSASHHYLRWRPPANQPPGRA